MERKGSARPGRPPEEPTSLVIHLGRIRPFRRVDALCLVLSLGSGAYLRQTHSIFRSESKLKGSGPPARTRALSRFRNTSVSRLSRSHRRRLFSAIALNRYAIAARCGST
jgi:hypothetical protein